MTRAITYESAAAWVAAREAECAARGGHVVGRGEEDHRCGHCQKWLACVDCPHLEDEEVGS